MGNRIGVWLNGTRVVSQTHDAADQVVGWSYDAAGNLLNDGTTSYGYDALNRLIQQGSTTNAYNGDGVLIHSGVTTYTQDLASPLSQVLQTTQSLTTTEYFYGQHRLAAVDGSTRTWYVHDALGSVRQTLNDSGTVLGSVDYDPWGQVESGSVPTFGFTGELQDDAGMVYLRARWYNAAHGAFTAKDPFEGYAERPYSLNPYQYAYANPVLWTDPSGKLAIFVMGGYGPTTDLGPKYAAVAMAYWLQDHGALPPGPTIVSDALGGDHRWQQNNVLKRMLEEICAAHERNEPIALVGNSRGGASVHIAASITERLWPDIMIDLVVSIAIVPGDMDNMSTVDFTRKPGNVKKYLNYVSDTGYIPLYGAFWLNEIEVSDADNPHDQRVIRNSNHFTVPWQMIPPQCWYPEEQNNPALCIKNEIHSSMQIQTYTVNPDSPNIKGTLNPLWDVVKDAFKAIQP